MPRAMIVYNPAAGRLPPETSIGKCAFIFRESGWQVESLPSQSGAHLTELARQAASKGMDAFIVAGGDGSVNCAAKGLKDSATALGVLPAGTSNVWAKEIGLPTPQLPYYDTLEDSARLLCQGEVSVIDTGTCNGTFFVQWAGIGLSGKVIRRMEPSQRWQKQYQFIRYFVTSVVEASLWRGVEMHVEADGVKCDEHLVLATACNIHLYAGGAAQLSPDAQLDDGRMELWLFRGYTLGDTLRRYFDLLAGKHLHSQQMRLMSFQSLVIEADIPLMSDVDGELVERISNRAEVQVLPRSLHVLTPPKTVPSYFHKS